MELLAIISIIFSLYAIYRVSALDKKLTRLGELPREDVSPVNHAPAAQHEEPAAIHGAEINTTASSIKTSSETSDPFSRLIAWYVKDWPLKTGALFILMGCVWLMTYAFMNNWIGEMGRVTLGLIVGSLVLLGAEYRMRTSASQGITLTGLGASIVIFATYAGRHMYDLFPPIVGMSFLVATMAFVVFVSLRHKSLSLAVGGLIISGLTPLLIASETRSVMGLFGYLLAVASCFLFLGRYATWRIITPLTMLLVVMYSASYLFSSYESLTWTVTPKELLELRFFAMTFMSLFFLTNIGGIMTRKKADTVDLSIALGIGALSVWWILTLSPEMYRSILVLAAGIISAGAAYVVSSRSGVRSASETYTIVGVVLLATATAIELDGPALAIAFAVQALVVPLIAGRVMGLRMTKWLLWYHLPAGLIGLSHIGMTTLDRSFFIDHLPALLAITASQWFTGYTLYTNEGKRDPSIHQLSIFFLILGSVMGLLTLWRTNEVVLTLMNLTVNGAPPLIIYTIIGLGTYLMGKKNARPILGRFGLGILIFVIGRLLLVELWDMDLAARIVTFFLIGIMFIFSVLLGKSSSQRV